MSSKPACLFALSSAAEGVSAQSFVQSYTLCSSAFTLHIATPGGKLPEFVHQDEASLRWLQDFCTKPQSTPLRLESVDGARYNALFLPSSLGALSDLAHSGYLAQILQHFVAEKKPICAVGHGVAGLCCALKEDRGWAFRGYSLTGPSVFELVRKPGFANLPVIVEDFCKESGATYSASEVDAVHVVIDRHVITGQNEQSTVAAAQNLVLLSSSRK
ncbi:glutamine amidotransferase-like class 1 domain-containing protein 1 [Petromyzon marinus]|uniref:Glutamine amidotransferase-like class 1 domain-containing protein 1 n=1 Tax=Petromyzon marinus TaxID=7757 RepID=A0AAJ7TDK8_PETMA|nr:glutamine amidotransferase-like class 1 domain-containing protein 1 [Petromyzon marinus]